MEGQTCRGKPAGANLSHSEVEEIDLEGKSAGANLIKAELEDAYLNRANCVRQT